MQGKVEGEEDKQQEVLHNSGKGDTIGRLEGPSWGQVYLCGC